MIKALRLITTGSKLEFQWISFKHEDNHGSFERSLPVVNWDVLQELGLSGFLRTFATDSEWGILSNIGMIGVP